MTRQRTRLFMIAGAIAPALFLLVATIDGFTKPGYDARRDFVSDLALADHGWVQIANFIVVGLLLVAFACGLRQLFPTGRASVFGPLLVGLAGLSLVVCGIFWTDPTSYPAGADTTPTTRGAIHNNASNVLIISVIVGCVIFALRLRHEPAWRGYAAYSAITAVVVLAATISLAVVGPGQSSTGVVQRIWLAIFFLWYEVIALRALRLVTNVPALSVQTPV
jgi:hypothetical membrane protein